MAAVAEVTTKVNALRRMMASLSSSSNAMRATRCMSSLTTSHPYSVRLQSSTPHQTILSTMGSQRISSPGIASNPIQQMIPRNRWLSTEAGTSDKKEEGGDDKATTEEESPTEESEETVSEEETLKANVAKLEEEIKDLKNQLLRSLADQENTRTIAKRDVSNAREFAISSFAKSLLDVSDNFQRALEAVPQDDLKSGEHPTLQSLYQGIELTNNELHKSFEKNGLVQFCEEPGDVFDPTIHDALMEYEDATKTPGTVGQVIKTGFKLNSRIIRPAKVGVIKKPAEGA